ncbi:MAG: MAPEG family protein [Deltaproteobacteria bacterium]|nr:MAPEG family protein [Deltaproteobacteria bacterium]MBW2362817.1 MAPEG family protein [Deltaproteobacteria bacterium]
MELVAIVIGIALLEYFYFTMKCGSMRGERGVPAPAMSGDAKFERYFRVQYNTLEQLAIFLPSIVLFGHFVSAPIGAGIGLIFVLGRALFARGYWQDPARRGPGFGLTVLANLALLLGGMVGAVLAYID